LSKNMLLSAFGRWTIYSRAPCPLIWYLRFTVAPQKLEKLKKWTVYKFQNMWQVRMGHNMVQSSSPNMHITWLIFLCPRTHSKTSESVTFLCTTERDSTL
jgi:hypothetical protein